MLVEPQSTVGSSSRVSVLTLACSILKGVGKEVSLFSYFFPSSRIVLSGLAIIGTLLKLSSLRTFQVSHVESSAINGGLSSSHITQS